MVDLDAFIKNTTQASEAAFKGEKRILSFRQFLESFSEQPVRLGRNAAQYLLDCFDHYGTEEVDGIGEKVTRYKLFDAPFEGGHDQLYGHEPLQREIYDLLRRFSAMGRSDRLVLLHGPNGSGKSSCMDLIFRGLEHYSALPEGTIFRFNWIFTERLEGKGHMGFGGSHNEIPRDTLAFVDENMISCKIVNELRENPVFLIPPIERARLLDSLIAENPKDNKRVERLHGAFLREGTLSTKSKLIYDALLNAYHGDWQKVLKHVQVERFFISKRYRMGAAVIEPQQAVDAGARPMTFEHGVTLPPVLQGLNLLELSGELIDASAGVVEYSDMLKRPIEMNKYLLNTCERGTISLHGAVANLNLVMLGTCNEKYLSAFKTNPDFTSFKGRFELVRAGYLLEWKKERAVYQAFLEEIKESRAIAPHTADVVALWAVMTRLRRPDPSKYPEELGGVLRRLNPLEKARLYGEGKAPDRLSTDEKRSLLSVVPQLRDEHNDETAEFEDFTYAAYEGRRGASAREVNSLLAEAAESSDNKYLSPLRVFEAIRNLLKDTSVYDFLRLEADEGFHDMEQITSLLEGEYLRWISVEIYDCMELVAESEFGKRVEEYFRQIRAYASSEKVENPRTGKYEEASAEIMNGLEKLIDLKEPADSFRRNLIGKVAAHSLDHKNEKLNYADIFPDLFWRLRDSYYREKQQQLETLARYVLISGTEDQNMVPAAEKPRVERTLKNMHDRYGYNEDSAKEAISHLLRKISEKS